MINYTNLDESKAFSLLKQQNKPMVKKIMSAERISRYQAPVGAGLAYNYAGKPVDDELLLSLQKLADEMQVIDKYQAIINGEMMNTGEKRKVLHHLCRGQLGSAVNHEGKDLFKFYEEQRQRIADFAEKVHQGTVKGSTGKPLKTLVQIGIGGSDLGPRAIYMALERLYTKKMEAHFISNVDPDDANEVLSRLDLETTLFILVTKSGTTQETLANLNFVLEKAKQQAIAGFDIHQHVIAVTSETSPLANNPQFKDSFYIDDFIGGRFSSSSAVGGAVLSLAFGSNVFKEFLDGAHEADRQALNPDIRTNAALLDALIGVYERNILDYRSTAILPYSQALSRFPAHLQQADMESNGKMVNRDGRPVNYVTGPVIFGEPGTNGQHSFYQLLHQGSDIIPLQFIGFINSQIDGDINFEGSNSQTKLKANLAAQMTAFLMGKEDHNLNKNFTGGRPVSLIYGEKLTAACMGALLAHYENKVMFQGFLWNLNSFDQEGVQLGKVLATQLLKGEGSDVLKNFASLLKL